MKVQAAIPYPESPDGQRMALSDRPFFDAALLAEVGQAIQLSTNQVSTYKAGCRQGRYEGFCKGPFFDPGFTYRLKQSLDVYWEDDVWDNSLYYQQAETLVQTACEIHQSMFTLVSKKNETRFEIFRRVSKAKQILDSEQGIHFNLEMLSRECIMSKYFLVRNFKQVYRVTPQKYITYRKLDMAMRLLLEGVQLRIVSERLGYPDVFSFSKQFKKYKGISPGKVRKKAA